MLGLAGGSVPAGAQDGEASTDSDDVDGPGPPVPEQLEVVNRLHTSVQIAWDDVEGTERYAYYVDGTLEGYTGSSFVDVVELEPETTYEIAVAAQDESGARSERTSTTVTTAASRDSSSASIETSIDPKRTDAEGRPGVVVSVSDLPEDSRLESYQIYLESPEVGQQFTDVYAWLDGVDADGPMEPLTFGRLGTHHAGRVKGTARDDPPTAGDEPIELVTVFHSEVESPGDEIPFDVQPELLVVREADERVDPWQVYDAGVEHWDIAVTETEELLEEPEVSVLQGDAVGGATYVVVTGTHEFSQSGCDTLYPRVVSYSEHLDRFGVSVDDVSEHELDPTRSGELVACGDSTQRVQYELTAVVDAVPERVVTEERFADRDRTVHYFHGEPGPTLGPAVAEYEFEVDGDLGFDGSVEADPEVAFEGDQLVVTGAVRGSNTCYTAVVDRLQYGDAANLEFEVGVESAYRDEYMPGDGCGAAEVSLDYELVVEFEGDLPDYVSVSEQGSRQVTVEREADRELPEGVEDVELQIGDDVDYGQIEPPGPHTGFDENTYYAYGTWFELDGSCETVDLGRLEFASDDREHFGVSIENGLQDGVSDEDACSGDETQTSYALEVTFADDALPRTVHLTVDDANHYTTRVTDRGRDPIALPDGVVDYELSEQVNDGPAPAEPTVDFSNERVTVTASIVLGQSTCKELGLRDLSYADDDHLEVQLGGVYQDRASPFSDCEDDLFRERYVLTIEFEDLPAVLTVEEDGIEEAHTVTVERDDCAASAVVDGQTVCDLDGDGSYRDVNGDGSVSNGDVTEFFGNQHAPAWDERTDLFDFDGDGDVGQSDVVELFHYVN